MIHTTRPYSILPVADVETLAEHLTAHTWTRCQGFVWHGLFLLNDSFSEDGAQEYAVFRAGRAVESLTVSWMKPADLITTLQQLATGDVRDYGPLVAVLETPAMHQRCRYCA